MLKKTASIRGIYRDIIKDENHRIIYDSGWKSNLIVDRCRVLIAAFMKNENTRGIQKVKLGRGQKEWDNEDEGPPAPVPATAALEDPEPYLVDENAWSLEYLDENDQHANTPTDRLQVTITLGENQPPAPADSVVTTYPIREFGLFGVFTDGAGDHDYMIDCIRHQVIHKDTSATLIRKVKLYF
ncbi:MAG: hypothetical protein KAW12_04235 [Candidatus Aminicenantes bacterium]|nr:hypothetical protein [Candidatus Aminicenantes bacterium]